MLAEYVQASNLELQEMLQFEFLRRLIAKSALEEERLFPLVRAIVYLQTGNEALIENLLPEVRGIVEDRREIESHIAERLRFALAANALPVAFGR